MSAIEGRKIIDPDPVVALNSRTNIPVESLTHHDSETCVLRVPNSGDISNIFGTNSSTLDFIIGYGGASDLDTVDQLALCFTCAASAGAGNTSLNFLGLIEHIEFQANGQLLDSIFSQNLIDELQLLPSEVLQSIGPGIGLQTQDVGASSTYMRPNVVLAPSAVYKFQLPIFNSVFTCPGFSPRAVSDQLRIRVFFNPGTYAQMSNSAKAATTVTCTKAELLLSGRKYSSALRTIKDAERAGKKQVLPTMIRRYYSKTQGTLTANQEQTESVSFLNGRFVSASFWLSKPVNPTIPESLYQVDATNSLTQSSFNLDKLTLVDSQGRPCSWVDGLDADFQRLALGSYQLDNQAHTIMRHYIFSFASDLSEEYWTNSTKMDRKIDGLYNLRYTPDANFYTGGPVTLYGAALQAASLVIDESGSIRLFTLE